MKLYGNEIHTHGDPVYLRVIGFVVVAVKGSFADCKCSLDGERVFSIYGCCSEMLVNVVHSWYDGCNVGGASRKKECRVLEELTEL